MRDGSGRTRLSGLLGFWYLDGLFGIVETFWPVVVEGLELHGGWGGGMGGVKHVEGNKVRDAVHFKSRASWRCGYLAPKYVKGSAGTPRT